MSQTIEEKNKKLVLDAFETLFNKRDYAAAEKYWSPNYIQHSAHIEPGRDGLFNLVRNSPDTLRYEHQLIVAEGTMSLFTGVSQEWGGRSPGSPRTLSGSRTAAWPNTGTSCKTRQQERNRRAACQCLANASLPEPSRLRFAVLLKGEDRGQRGETAKALATRCGIWERAVALS
jgi:hypothetical protein